MSLGLNNLQKTKRVEKNRKRIGRGNASGHGTYSGKGIKGQRSRAGVSNLKRLGMKARLLQIPKTRGFKSIHDKNQVVSVEFLNKNYKDGETVSPETLVEKKAIKNTDKPVKILGKEKLTVKDLKFEGVKMSEGLQSQLKK
ncbi:50S ribosomal protein L15 [bacterium]|nr:50S ribosomal protein L15 [bacterium]